MPAEPSILVSVIIASYNYARFLPEAVRSVQSQTYPHWECIILDDASTDNTSDIAADLVRSDSRIRYYRNESNLGVSGTRNRGTALANGELIAVLDADDWWNADKLQAQIGAFVEKNQLQVSFTAYVRVDPQGATDKRLTDHRLYPIDQTFRANNLLLHSAVVMRKSAVESVNGYDTSLPCAHDWDLYLKILRRFGAEAFSYVDQPLAYYRMHGNSVSSRWKQMLADERTIIRKNLFAGGWAFRHPIAAWKAIDAQLEREAWQSTAAGDAHRAWICACGIAAIAPFRRWRWQQARRLFNEAFFRPPALGV
jgi:teichuronic acid biosynthesis glycosyltransferase TuaG